MASGNEKSNCTKPIYHRRKAALIDTIATYGIVQRQISRYTMRLETEGKGKYVAPDQLNRFLKNPDQDIYALALESIEQALLVINPQAAAYYAALVAQPR